MTGPYFGGVSAGPGRLSDGPGSFGASTFIGGPPIFPLPPMALNAWATFGQKTSILKCGSFSALWHCWQVRSTRSIVAFSWAVNCALPSSLATLGILSPGATRQGLNSRANALFLGAATCWLPGPWQLSQPTFSN